jgi:serine/threonine protein kinase
MTTLDDWPRVKRVLADALAREGAARQAYLAEACGPDGALRARVDHLLAAGDRVGTFLETSAARLLGSRQRQDLSGRVAGSYELVSLLGAGGMGEVYLAHDLRLKRPVAIKFLASGLAGDRDRLRRFHQEARAASGLNHPHIVVVHDFGELAGRPFLVTELIEGETLRQRLQRGPLPLREVLEIGIQVTGALGAAHAQGLVHRDVKPENIMVRPDGYAKVLDFGLAKLLGAGRPDDGVDAEPGTLPGMVIGTPRYMSPEQARGLDLDARSDVWSMGVVLYEMATGALPFAEDGAVMAFDAERAPGEGAHRDLPPALLRVVCRALHTVRDLRYADGAVLSADLKQVQRDGTPPRRAEAAAAGPRLRAPAALLAIALAALASVPLLRSGRATVATAAQRTVAVVPFDNVGGDAAIDYLGLALADEVATALSASPSLAVRPMVSSPRGISPQEAGRRLRAGTVVTGRFSLEGAKLRVTVEAVDVGAERLLWRHALTAPRDDAITIRELLTSRISHGLLPALGAAASVVPPPPRNAEAYALFLRSLAHSSDPRPNRDAMALLERASALDPVHADTWAALAARYYNHGHYGGGGGDALRRAEAAARQALALDPAHLPATVRLFSLQVEAGRLQDGYDSARRLVALRPDSGEAHYALSYVLRYGGLLEETAQACEEAVSRDPTNPLFRTCAQPFMLLGRYDRALDFVRLDPGSEWARLVTRLVYQRMGRRRDALEQHRQLAPEYLGRLAPDTFHGLLTRCLSGPADARQRASEDDVRAFLAVRPDPEPLYFWASDLAYCGDPAAALRLLRESVRRNFCAVAVIETDPTFASIRQEDGYGALLSAARACRSRFQEHVKARNPSGRFDR